MNAASYKTTITSRGLEYKYFNSLPRDSKPTLLFLHGFPSTSYDWRHQVSFFQEHGYGLIVPDMLGYGGTAKPTDPADYVSSLVCRDIIDLLDTEKVGSVIVIGHDWGCVTASRLHNIYEGRFMAYAFLAVGYAPPSPDVTYEQLLAVTKQLAGYELAGYWTFFTEDGAETVLLDNIEKFFDILIPEDPTVWKSIIGPTGQLKQWIASDNKVKPSTYITEEERRIQVDALKKGGFAGPLRWYKASILGLEADDVRGIPTSKYQVHQPVFFGAAKRDYVANAVLNKMSVAKYCENSTVHEFDTAHWIMWEAKDELNRELLRWLQTLGDNLSLSSS
ncbi:Alpha/Beta hydrolase protein [Infundibulicybe gibba]|nr:Alpha/Beta hydrolase protein [Infundibulicybe gibba]